VHRRHTTTSNGHSDSDPKTLRFSSTTVATTFFKIRAAFFFEDLQISGIITPWQTFTLIMRVLGASFFFFFF
jgi:hypothetical protein